jgi:predicted MPP superfamily phosphohydrolase
LAQGIDLVVLLTFFIVQFRITTMLLRSAAGRWAGVRLSAARWAIFAFDALLVAGYVLSFSELLSWLHMPPRMGAFMAAGALAYLIVATVCVVVRAVLHALLKRMPEKADPGRRRVLATAGNVVMAAPVVLLGYGTFIQRLDFGVREIDVPLDQLPPDLDGLRILQLSDIHRGAFLSDRDLVRVIDASLELKPNLAVITGDLISSRGDPLDSCIHRLARVKADAGVFGCMGNHERYAGVCDYTERAAARAGMRFLRGTSQALRFGSATLNLAGVDYQSKAEKPNYLRGGERLLAPGAVNVLLSHNPDVFPVAARQGYNLLLAGHTHGGQVTVEILDESINPARFFTPYVYGLYRSGAAAAYVTRGIGTIGLPTRIGAPPEISVVRLRKA